MKDTRISTEVAPFLEGKLDLTKLVEAVNSLKEYGEWCK
jgi:hypothetical protein